MFDCSKDLVAYHDEKVTLGSEEQSGMRDRRNANRDRLKKGLEKASSPLPMEHVSQGSYAMRTMVQSDQKDYDIDDGVYFEKADLIGPQGGDKTALDTRKMVRDAVDDGGFKTAPEVRNNCVRVYYNAGYHVDLPAYRQVTTKDIFGNEQVHFELASTDWVRSDARDVTEWFKKQNQSQSPDEKNGRQLRRIVRYLKKCARSRSSWKGQILSGFGITKLVTECFVSWKDRDDESLLRTMKAIKTRLDWSLVIQHPVTSNATITTGDDDAKAKFLKQKLADAIAWLEPTENSDCTQRHALQCWDTVFYTDFFGERCDESEAKQSNSNSSVLTKGMYSTGNLASLTAAAVRKEGGGRFA